MSYGYIQGQEAQALVYYKKLIEITSQPDERKKLEGVIALLEKVVAGKPPTAGVESPSFSNNAGCPVELETV